METTTDSVLCFLQFKSNGQVNKQPQVKSVFVVVLDPERIWGESDAQKKQKNNNSKFLISHEPTTILEICIFVVPSRKCFEGMKD